MSNVRKLAPGQVADVTLVLEGTYPYVSGGVSSWVHQIIKGLPEIKFSLVFIGSAPDKYEKIRYALPPNVVHLEEHYLSETPKFERIVKERGDAEFYQRSDVLHAAFRGGDPYDIGIALENVASMLLTEPARHEHDFLFSELSWESILAQYHDRAPDRSFLDYFWSIRSMHGPMFIAAKAAARVPPSRVFHVISTGFAGFLAMLLAKARKKPLILTEHGIYTKERRIELLQANWVKDDENNPAGIGFFRQSWIRYFELLAKMTYAAANPIVALYEGNRTRQIADGADPSRTMVVPNGIDLERFAPLRSQREAKVPKVLGLVGRVVPIKDIKTFVRAMKIVSQAIPDVEGWIVGPEGEDPTYARECKDLATSLGLDGIVKFLGFQKVEDILPKLGINVLTSISEAQPLSILEGFAAGIPSVASDVGCCAELIHGVGPEDEALGSAGAIVPIADPEATARACVALLRDEKAWFQAQRAAVERVETHYTQTQMIDRYRHLYSQALAAAEARERARRV